MDNGLPNLAAGKRRRDGTPIEEDVKDNLKVPRQRFGPQRGDNNGLKDGFQSNLQFQGLSVENLLWMQQQQQQQSEMAAGAPSLNMQQRVMAAAALQDLRCINESSKLFFQPQLQQHMKYGMQQQQQLPLQQQQHVSPQALQQIAMPDPSAGSFRELSPSQPPQSPLRPPPLIRTPPLYAEADIHNGSPTSSSSGPYPSSLPNLRTSQAMQLPKLENETSYSSMLHATQNSLLAHQSTGQQASQTGLLPTQAQPVQSSSSGMLPQQLGHSPHAEVAPHGGQGSQNGDMPPGQATRSGHSGGLLQQENGHGSEGEMSRQQQAGCASPSPLLQPQPANHVVVQSGLQSGLQSGGAHQQSGHHPLLQSGLQQNGNHMHQQQNGHASPNALQSGNCSYQQNGYVVSPNPLHTGMQNGSLHQQGGGGGHTAFQNGVSSGGSHCDSPRIGALSLLQNGLLHPQQSVHSSPMTPLPSGSQYGAAMQHPQGGPWAQQNRMMAQTHGAHLPLPQNGMGGQHSGHGHGSPSHGLVASHPTGMQGGLSSIPLPQQQMGLPPLLREFQGMQQVPGFWYPSSTREPCAAVAEAAAQPSSAGTLRLQQQRREAMAPSSSLGGGIFAPSLAEFGGGGSGQRGAGLAAPPLLPQLTQAHQGGGFRDVPSPDQELHSQLESQSPLQPAKGCGGSPSSRLGKVLPPHTDFHGRRLLQGAGGFCGASSSSGADAHIGGSPVMMANGTFDDPALLQRSVMCPPRVTRSYTKVYKLGSITRAVDVNRFSNYAELRCELARMFNLEGQLEQKLGWQLVFTDNEDDLLLVGDDPWEEFVRNVRGIRILTPAEVCFYTNEDKCAAAYSSMGGSAPKQP